MFSEQTLRRLWPRGDSKVPGLIAGIALASTTVFKRYGLTTPTSVAQAMAQFSEECGAGTEMDENMNYTAARIPQVWPSRFHSEAEALPFAHNPQALANNVYGGRMGNRPGTNDGYDFRGRGLSQVTGREGYQKLSAKVGLDLLSNPELVNHPDHALECAVADFAICGCVPYALADDIKNVTHHLNGGYEGLADREAWLPKWKEALAAEPATPAKPPTEPTKSKPPIVQPGHAGGAIGAGGAAAGAAHQAGWATRDIVIIGIAVFALVLVTSILMKLKRSAK
jgi:putative chitinase